MPRGMAARAEAESEAGAAAESPAALSQGAALVESNFQLAPSARKARPSDLVALAEQVQKVSEEGASESVQSACV